MTASTGATSPALAELAERIAAEHARDIIDPPWDARLSAAGLLAHGPGPRHHFTHASSPSQTPRELP